MASRGCRTLTIVFWLALWLALSFSSGVVAQIATQPASAPIEPSVAPELSAEAIKVRQQQVAEAADLDEETKAQVQDLYQKALEQLRLANEWTAKATEFETAMREAPARLEAIRAELAEPPPPPEPRPEIPTAA